MAEPEDDDVDQVADAEEDEVVDGQVDQEDDDQWDEEDDEDVDLLEAEDSAPWSPLPLSVARRYQEQHPDARPNFSFPTVYEENRTEKIRDLATAQAQGAITHRRAAEQVAAELGIEEYDYEKEQENIAAERKRGIGLPELGDGDQLARALGLGGHQGTPERQRDEPEPKRADLSGDAKAQFRRDMRQSASEAVTVIAPELRAPDIIIVPPAARPPARRQVEYDARGRAVRVIETDQGGQRHVLTVERDADGRLVGLRPAEEADQAEPVTPMLTKEETNYRYSGQPDFSCGVCRFFLEPGACQIVNGLIRPVDVCDRFELADGAPQPGDGVP